MVTLLQCQQETGQLQTDKPLFHSVPAFVTVLPALAEASGIADSKNYPDHLWVQEDSGNPPQLTLLRHNGSVAKTVYLKGITNRDWEDIALSGNQLYLGEIGDNNGVYPEYAFYKFDEPSSGIDTVSSVEIIRFKYPDGSHDAEAFLVDASGSIYIITKRDVPSRVYKLASPFTAGALHTASFVGSLPYSGVVSAALSPDGKEIIVKTYFDLGYYKRSEGEGIEAVLQKVPTLIPYQAEPQGEAVCFKADNGGYFTLSEKAGAADLKLYFYKRN